jgi:hypothetical protein
MKPQDHGQKLWTMKNKMQLFLAYLFIPNQLYMFRAMTSPIIRSTWLYFNLWCCPPILLPAGVMDEMEHLIHDTAVSYVH